MNYRHAYHAGNHADVLKHVVLARAIGHLARKDKPFRVIDAHAGIGLYSLESDEAGKTLEWREGLGRLYDEAGGRLALDDAAVEDLLSPWREMVEAVIKTKGEVAYRSVRATRGKAIRAEPVSALYEQGRVHHVGALPKLEDQSCQWDPLTSRKSPDRMDAMVWGITALSDSEDLLDSFLSGRIHV